MNGLHNTTHNHSLRPIPLPPQLQPSLLGQHTSQHGSDNRHVERLKEESKALHSRPQSFSAFPGSPSHALATADLERFSEAYFCDCDLRLYSPRTIETRRVFLRNFLWFLHKRGYNTCGTMELRQFFHYLMHGHEEAGGRFGNKQLNRPVRPITVKDYYIFLRSLFNWLVMQKFISDTPFIGIAKPTVHEEMKTSLSQAQIEALLDAAQESTNPTRNVALLWFLLDTGCRASELVATRLEDIDLKSRCCQVLGKGNKYRDVYFGSKTAQALWQYLEKTGRLHTAGQGRAENSSLFLSGRGIEPLTLSGLQQIMKRLKKRAGIRAACSPHAFRRSFAVETLRNGANVFSVQAMLGHTDLQMTQRYCALSQADVEAQHRSFSPVDRLLMPYIS